MKQWPVQDAKNQLSRVIDLTRTKAPQTITRHGQRVVVVGAAHEFKMFRSPKESPLAFFSRFKGLGLDFERLKGFAPQNPGLFRGVTSKSRSSFSFSRFFQQTILSNPHPFSPGRLFFLFRPCLNHRGVHCCRSQNRRERHRSRCCYGGQGPPKKTMAEQRKNNEVQKNSREKAQNMHKHNCLCVSCAFSRLSFQSSIKPNQA